jgi:hypothetical protein
MMRAKMTVVSVEQPYAGADNVKMSAVCGTNPEDNSYATSTPTASLDMVIQNPDLIGKIKTGMTFYVDFTPAE